ncbi:hypothetical protein FNJ87_12985 [Nonlabens mediterrranea]|uniref:DUF4476 domain-containing protein n=1 Tax=Nonlabens mediterrranea TaxID=1419947 RepID=A0ABS0A739_9FLAO|nr:hypothetical protein [Nonlabens mediterrranea]
MKKILFVAAMFLAIVVQAQHSPSKDNANETCEMQLNEKLNFMLDGSFANENVLFMEIAKLRPCGLDEFDVNFFGNMDVFNTMLARISKEKKVEQMTFNDLYTEIVKFKKADVYKEIREVTIASERLGETVGNIENWSQDLTLFENLGASQDVINKVYDYLKAHPDNKKTYKEILGLLKKQS